MKCLGLPHTGYGPEKGKSSWQWRAAVKFIIFSNQRRDVDFIRYVFKCRVKKDSKEREITVRKIKIDFHLSLGT